MSNESKDEILFRISEILYYLWDPIGISTANSPRDEYDGYVMEVFNVMYHGATHEELSNHLKHLVIDVIIGECTDKQEQKNRQTAKLLAEIFSEEASCNFPVIDVD
ncbi:MAG: hypothetical protein GX665_03040 [Gammaproteobacteria bacterium]|nr:hypothetical protein [Gammaproteobacteria bacterium]